jgi:two-component system response regulator PfeR
MSCLGFDLTIRGKANKILLIEDDVALNDQLSELLSNAGYRVERCFSGEEGLNLTSTQHYQLIVLDVMHPKLDGFSLLNILRKTTQTPVIMLTAKGAEEDRIRGFYYGADDCLTKPFSTTELLLRINVMLKRRRGDIETTNGSGLQLDSLYLDKTDKSAKVHSKLVGLTPTEFRLLWVLVQHKGDVLKKAFLYQTVLNKTLGRHDRSLDVHLSRVRKKLNAMGWQGERLLTVHGEGYRMS